MISSEIISVGADKLKCLINSDEIRHKVDLLANQIRTDMGEEETPLFICVLKGAFMFASDFLLSHDVRQMMTTKANIKQIILFILISL